jgi:tetratricopeptide (TPR) repeat protein
MTSNRQIAAARTIAVALASLALCAAAFFTPGFSFADQSADEIAESRPLIESGITAYEGGDYTTAVIDLTRAEQLYPANSSISLYLGLAYLRQNRLSDAIAAWQRYIKLAPSTESERQNDLKEKVPQFLSILRAQNDRDEAEQALKHEHTIGPGDPNAIAITYFRNLGSPELTPLQKGLTALLIDDISKLPRVKVVERERLQALLSELKLGKSGLASPRTAAREGRLLGAGKVATGSYLDPSKGALDIDSVLAKTAPGSPERSVQIAQGQVVQFYDLEKEIARKIIVDLGYDMNKLDPAVVASIEEPQTRSLDAFTNFSRGLDERDRQHPDLARVLFQRALSYDSNFKLAQHELRSTPITRFTIAQVENQTSAAAPSAAAAAAVVIASAGTGGGSGGGTGGNRSSGGSITGGNGNTTGSGDSTTGSSSAVSGGSGPPILSNPLPLAVAPPAPPALACPPCPACIAIHR